MSQLKNKNNHYFIPAMHKNTIYRLVSNLANKILNIREEYIWPSEKYGRLGLSVLYNQIEQLATLKQNNPYIKHGIT